MLGSIDGYGINADDDMSAGYAHYVTKLAQASGKTVGLLGANFGRVRQCPAKPSDAGPVRSPYMNCDGLPVNFDKDVDLLARHWAAGGLVTVTWIAPNPWTGGSFKDTKIVGDFSDLYTQGTQIYSVWHKMLDEVAEGLSDLQKRGVVVIYRPLMEQNGGWFWWGNRGPGAQPNAEQFRALWQDMFIYLTRKKQLHNLLWLYAVNRSNTPGDMLVFEPESKYYDLIGLDYYANKSEHDVAFDDLLRPRKPVVLAEYGPDNAYALDEKTRDKFDFLRVLALRQKFPSLVYFMAWNGSYAHQALAQNANADALLKNPAIMNLGDFDWKR
jgi:mannan endo-1,4-beta-mannosidase